MKVRTRPTKPRRHAVEDERFKSVNWKMAAPFVVNPRGVLVHRVKDASTMFQKWDHKEQVEVRDVCTYWCNNGCHSAMEFFENPPDDRLLCAACEANAVKHGEKTADELAGRHVHIGVLKAHRTCCSSEVN